MNDSQAEDNRREVIEFFEKNRERLTTLGAIFARMLLADMLSSKPSAVYAAMMSLQQQGMLGEGEAPLTEMILAMERAGIQPIMDGSGRSIFRL